MSRAALAAWGAAFAFTAACGASEPAYGGPPPPDEETAEEATLEDESVSDDEEAPVGDDAPLPDETEPEEDIAVPAYGAPPEP